MDNNINNYGLLINQNIKLHRKYFKEMCKLLGIKCKYYAPRSSKEFDEHGEIDPEHSQYYMPETVEVIFQEHPDQKTLKKMGWVAELQESSSIIHVPYDLAHLQYGALFEIPSGIDGAPNRLFRVIAMQNTMIYPASIACEIAPEYKSKEEPTNTQNFKQHNFTLLKDNEDDD